MQVEEFHLKLDRILGEEEREFVFFTWDFIVRVINKPGAYKAASRLINAVIRIIELAEKEGYDLGKRTDSLFWIRVEKGEIFQASLIEVSKDYDYILGPFFSKEQAELFLKSKG